MISLFRKPKAPALAAKDRIVCKVVAVIRENDTWGAYAGGMDESEEQIVASGLPLSKSMAELLFVSPRNAGYIYRP